MQSRPLAPPCLALLALVAIAAACGDPDGYRIDAVQAYPDTPRTVFGGERPVTIQVPTTYDSSHPLPLLVILHGYGANGFLQQAYFRLEPLVESEGILMVAPDGTRDESGSRFWSATPACCGVSGGSVDDVGYLRGLIADIRRDYNVDRKRIYLIGHSNGGFMAHRMACEAAREIAAIVSLAGATFSDPGACAPAEAVSVLGIHGDADDTVLYGGGTIRGFSYPGAIETVSYWQAYNRCAPGLVADPTPLNLESRLAGKETEVQRFTGCAGGSAVELWTIRGGGHIPALTRDFAPLVWQWLSAHPKG